MPTEPTAIAETTADWRDRIERTASKLAERPPVDPVRYPSAEELEAAERRWEARIPVRYRGARVSDLTGELAECAEWDGKRDVLLLGNVGTGKTHAAVALARTAHDAGRLVLFTHTLAFIDDLKPDGDPQAMPRALDADVLVLDDLGTERQREFGADRISRLLVDRYNACRPTIVTSNLDPPSLEAQIGERVWSRLFDDSLRIMAAGPDRRRA